eukprot:1012301-Alexandrium_andersonii.AAC.1
MSASLVGSEMCIRDRRCTSPPSAAGGPSSARSCETRPLAAAQAGTTCFCLLYTSDAADDM